MKPMRGLPGSWLSSMPRERRTALISLAIMLVLLGSLVAYQRLTMNSETPIQLPLPEESPERGTRVEKELPVSSEAGSTLPQALPTSGHPLMHPLGGKRKVLKAFASVDEAYGDFRLYTGVAYAAGAGDPVLAAGAGSVVQAEEHPLDGGVLVLDHGNGLSTRYAGLGKLFVAPNATVQAGTVIGQIGAPGPARRDLGTHLHLQVLVQGEPVDPVTFFPK